MGDINNERENQADEYRQNRDQIHSGGTWAEASNSDLHNQEGQGKEQLLPKPPGHPPSLSIRSQIDLIIDIKRHPKDNFKDIVQRNTMSASMGRQLAAENDLFRRVAQKKPFLYPEHHWSKHWSRHLWAEEREGQDGSGVIFTDETAIEMGDQCCR